VKHLLTSSRIKIRRACPRADFHRYEQGLVSVAPESGAQAFGTAVHAALEAWWRAWMVADGYGSLPGALDAIVYDPYLDANEYVRARALAMIYAYDARWSRWAASVKVLGVEVPFTTALRHPVTGQPAKTWAVAGKIDLIVRLADGRVALVDHKTTSADARSGSDYSRRLTLDPQVSTYFLGCEALGMPADLALWDVLRKPDVRPLLATPAESRVYTKAKDRACKECAKKKSAPAPHFDDDAGVWCAGGRVQTDPGGALKAGQREYDETPEAYQERCMAALADDGPESALSHIEVVRSSTEVEAHGWALWHTVREIEETRAAVAKAGGDVRAVPQNADACLKYGTPCPYLPLCEGTANAADVTRYRRLPVVHGELPTEIQTTRAA